MFVEEDESRQDVHTNGRGKSRATAGRTGKVQICLWHLAGRRLRRLRRGVLIAPLSLQLALDPIVPAASLQCLVLPPKGFPLCRRRRGIERNEAGGGGGGDLNLAISFRFRDRGGDRSKEGKHSPSLSRHPPSSSPRALLVFAASLGGKAVEATSGSLIKTSSWDRGGGQITRREAISIGRVEGVVRRPRVNGEKKKTVADDDGSAFFSPPSPSRDYLSAPDFFGFLRKKKGKKETVILHGHRH